ncbi:hypothetical protein [Lactiplantibacillus plantarum]|uniref:hypothetical protein n=1 Tax=Lactiplantibacillus plantarum TaxID=1590 RepID=UPI00280A8E32|nr:hypothetical protein [Lactiplantibacillus plantarum]
MLRIENRIFKKLDALDHEKISSRETVTLIDDLRRVFKTSISFILKAVKVPRSTYYYTKHSQGRKYEDDQVIQAIDEIRQTDAKYTQKYGYRRITLVMHERDLKLIINASSEL